MEVLTLILLLAISVLISAVIDQFIPRVSLPLIQVGMGVVISLFAFGNISIELEPELFLVVFIAPLLYIEAKHTNKADLWVNIKPILSLAIGLVVVSTLIIGFAVNAVLPVIPLAAAFALGAALGPTDAVAVTSLEKQVSIPKRQWNILKGELLLNDASGIVAFQFALTAAMTGTFSWFKAGESFLMEFIGGLVVGVVLGYGFNLILRKIRDIGIESTTFHVLYELCIPFLVYLGAQSVHVSGIIAVVVAGLVNVIAPRTISPQVARMNIVSSNVWDVLSFTLNGIVFVLLGTQLPASMVYAWDESTISPWALALCIIGLTCLLMGIRFLWCLGMEWVHTHFSDEHKFTKEDARNALITTLCGAKGTITLSILFTIPVYMTDVARFPERDLIIFLGSGVILCTLLIATFVVPLVAPKRERRKSEEESRQHFLEALSNVIRNVIEQLTAQQTKRNRRSTRIVINAYQDRLANIKNELDEDDEPNTTLRLQALDWEEDRVMELIELGETDADTGYSYLDRLERIERYIRHRDDRSFSQRVSLTIKAWTARLKTRVMRRVPEDQLTVRQERMRQLQINTAQYVIEQLRAKVFGNSVPTEDASKLLLEYERTLAELKHSNPSVTATFRIADESTDIRRLAYQLELEQIQKMYEDNRINRQQAKRMRDNVYLMQMDLEDSV